MERPSALLAHESRRAGKESLMKKVEAKTEKDELRPGSGLYTSFCQKENINSPGAFKPSACNLFEKLIPAVKKQGRRVRGMQRGGLCRTARPSVASILSTASAPCRSASKFKVAAKPCNVTLRRGSEQLFILTAEIRRVFITDAETGACYVQVFAEHQAARFL